MRRRKSAKKGHRKVAILGGVMLAFLVIGAVIYLGRNPPISGGGTSIGLASGIKAGDVAPDFAVKFTNGSTANLSDFRGHPLLLWFVTTWCSSCQDGAQLLSTQYYSQLNSKGVTILTVELYNNLRQSGPSITQFAEQYGGGAKQGWLYGTSGQGTTYTYDSSAYLDIYYAIDSKGVILTSGVGLPYDLAGIVLALE